MVLVDPQYTYILYTKWTLWLPINTHMICSYKRGLRISYKHFVRPPPKINNRHAVNLNVYTYFYFQVTVQHFRVHMYFDLIVEVNIFHLTPILYRYLHGKCRYHAINGSSMCTGNQILMVSALAIAKSGIG